jgi:predicted PurR-regulated permease PerM
MDALVVEAGTSDPRPDATGESASNPRPVREALGAIERAVSSIRIVPLLMGVGALWWGQTVLIPIVLSVLVSYALEPVVARLQAWRVPRTLGVPLLLGALVAGTGGAIYALRGEAMAFGNRLPDAAHKLAEAIGRQKSDAPGPVAKMQQAANELEKAAATNRQPRPKDGVTSVRIEEPTFKWSDWLWQGSHGAMDMTGQLFAVVCLVYYLLIAGDMYKRKFVRIVGPSMSDKKTTVQILAEIDRQIARFLWTRAVISGAIGAAIWIAFRLLGLEEPGVWAVLSAFLFTVPVVGPVLVILGAGVAGFVQFGTPGMAGVAAGVTAAIAAIEGYVLTPLLMSRVGEMNAVAVFVSLMFWGWMWGIWGLLLAVPMTAAIKAVCERVDDLNAFAELLKA